jgi:hypothetical protein
VRGTGSRPTTGRVPQAKPLILAGNDRFIPLFLAENGRFGPLFLAKDVYLQGITP